LILTEDTATTRWNGVVPDAWYQLDFTPTLDPSDWRSTGPAVPAVTSTIQLDDGVSPDPVERYYRLRRLFPAPIVP
jgi:hypothetical protein